MKPRIRLVHLFALTILCALVVQNALLRRRLDDTQLLVPSDTIAVQIPGLWNTNRYPTFEVVDTKGTNQQITGFPISVLEDGSVNLPKIGKLQVAGRSIEQVRVAIADASAAMGTPVDIAEVRVEAVSKRSVVLASP